MTLPPRLTAGTLDFVPKLALEIRQQLMATPTWTGHSAKVLVRYRRAFWRDQHLSGFAVSREGPLEEIHDVSSPDQHLTALFGFLIGGPVCRERTLEERRQAVLSQLTRLFGLEAHDLLSYHEMDWVQERYASSAEDAVVPPADFSYGHAFLRSLRSGVRCSGSARRRQPSMVGCSRARSMPRNVRLAW